MAHTAVIYFHGIGEQRRYEEISVLVEALDSQCSKKNTAGVLQDIAPKVETNRVAGHSDVAYIQAVYASKSVPSQTRTYRFYEAYWAPLTAEGISVFKVLRWSLRQLAVGLFQRSLNWRFRQRLRRSSFWSLIDSLARKTGLEPHTGDVHCLLDNYNKFDSIAGNDRYPNGTFAEFVRFLTDIYKVKKDYVLVRLLKLVRLWRRHDRTLRWKTRFVCLTTLLFCLLLAAGSTIALFQAIINISELFTAGLNNVLEAFFQAMLTVSLLGVMLAIGRLLRTYVADIEFWATYEETDVKHKKRKEILDLGFALLQHLLLDDECKRIVVIGHSLGTAIAYDTLLQAGRHNRARDNANGLKLDKIEALITLGSPLDKIHWFFESYQSHCFRYRKVVEELRGDIGTPPFAVNGIPQIYWLNLWDKVDPISGSLETPSSNTSLEIRIDNFHVNFRSLNPLSCHCGYFKNPTVLELISKVIFEHHNPYSRQKERFGFLGPGKFGKISNLPGYLFIALTWAAILLFTLWLT